MPPSHYYYYENIHFVNTTPPPPKKEEEEEEITQTVFSSEITTFQGILTEKHYFYLRTLKNIHCNIY